MQFHWRRLRAATSSAVIAFAALAALAPSAQAADSKFLAPGFVNLKKDSSVVLMPIDVELFELSAGGVAEPKADWTASAHEHMKAALSGTTSRLGLKTQSMAEADADEFAELIGLQAAVARSINLHHATGGAWALPSKEGKLDWTFGDSMQALQAKTGARYGLFIWVRDSYASAARKAAMVGLALLGVGISGGIQIGHASLVDLQTGTVLWFNTLARGSGDLREPQSASETISQLLTGFPSTAP
ncbi:hypothetical protein H5407_09650 [Mitsuaria sp. WAJ17]|uniref:hypothetical protein n=1 Tax=Mitsuaria sp. WAJ17 TaxID=2761452 RepID=UPI001600FE23|nr:hypothetical protein [Mitsuaria sp. WAJ17]MBB2485491.1 hypothetical protein [Mitsuaria sp. WAJ17]